MREGTCGHGAAQGGGCVVRHMEQRPTHVCFKLLARLVGASCVRAERSQAVKAPLVLGDNSNVLRIPPDFVLRRAPE
eukprot:scaffold2483_cov135-Isochrysis_galbana.AAC.3